MFQNVAEFVSIENARTWTNLDAINTLLQVVYIPSFCLFFMKFWNFSKVLLETVWWELLYILDKTYIFRTEAQSLEFL